MEFLEEFIKIRNYGSHLIQQICLFNKHLNVAQGMGISASNFCGAMNFRFNAAMGGGVFTCSASGYKIANCPYSPLCGVASSSFLHHGNLYMDMLY